MRGRKPADVPVRKTYSDAEAFPVFIKKAFRALISMAQWVGVLQ